MDRGKNHGFQALQPKLMTKTVLQYPDSLKKFILTVDDSNSGLDNGNDLPTAYASCSLNKAAISYEKELFATKWTIHYFWLYLYGQKIATDHKPLTWIMNVKDPYLRLFRWRIHLEGYEYEVKYKNTNTDTLMSGCVMLEEAEPQNVEIDDTEIQ
jgi:hypothetical protein